MSEMQISEFWKGRCSFGSVECGSHLKFREMQNKLELSGSFDVVLSWPARCLPVCSGWYNTAIVSQWLG